VAVHAEPFAAALDPLVLTVQPQVLLLKYEPETAMVSPGPYVVLLTEMWACGLHAHAIAAGTITAASAIRTKKDRRRLGPTALVPKCRLAIGCSL
jgi:hypothetical protein